MNCQVDAIKPGKTNAANKNFGILELSESVDNYSPYYRLSNRQNSLNRHVTNIILRIY